MSATIPPAPPPARLPNPVGGGQAVVQVVAADPKVVEAVRTAMAVEAVVQTRAVRGVVEVATPYGAISLKLPPDVLPLAVGSRLMLQFPEVAGARPETLHLTAINGRALLPNGLLLGPATGVAAGADNLPNTPGLARPVGGQPNPVSGGRAMGNTPPGSMTRPGNTGPMPPGIGSAPGITATVLRPASPSGTMAQPGDSGLRTDMAPGTTITVRIAGTVPPGLSNPTGVVPGREAPQGQVPAPTPLVESGHPGGRQVAPLSPAPMQPQVSRPAALPLPPTAAPPPAATAPVVTGTVVAHPPSGQAVLQTPLGTLAVPSQAPIPVGTQVILEVVGKPEAPQAPPLGSKPDVLGAAGWPNLTEAAQTLQRTDAQLAEQFLRVIPQANARLAASMVAFTGSLRSGDARQIVTDAVSRGLERAGKRHVSDALKGDIDGLSADSTRSLGGGEWRAYTLPFMNGGEIERIRLFVRNVGDQDGGGRQGGGDEHRFILEISMRRLGRIQLDGMVKRADKAFDLIMRTEAPLPADMRRDILAIFAENGEICGTKGMVVFQSGRFVDLPPDASPTALMA